MPQHDDAHIGGGNCYEAAFLVFIDLVSQNPRLKRTTRLVHGLCRNASEGPDGGRWMGHAWVECNDRGRVTCIDASGLKHGRPLAVSPRDTYYEAGTVQTRHLYRYGAKEAVRLMQEHDTYGPFEGVLVSDRATDVGDAVVMPEGWAP